jgi:ABC-type antimicrobial peptide transport system permease subunit
VRYRDNVAASSSSRDLTRLAGILASYNPQHVNPAQLASISTLSVQHPAEIVNYRTMGAAPIILGFSLALGASMALAATLFASIRLRRRDLALLKSLGFTRRQLQATVMWQSSVIIVLGALIGVPLGIALGRVLWNAFADELHVLARPIVPPIWVAIIAVGAVVLGIAVAALPGRSAARIPAGTLLRDE